MADYDKLQQTVNRLLFRYGKPCQVIHVTPGEYDPDTGMMEGDLEIVYGGRVIDMSAGLEHLPGTVVQAGELAGYLRLDDAFSAKPTLTMKIQIHGDVTRTFRQLQPIQPGDVCLYWKFVATA